MTDDRRRRTNAGHYYVQDDAGRLREVGPGTPDVIICRRLEDYPGDVFPAGGALARCSSCQRPIVHNPAKFPDVPRICMQCGGIQPEPFPTS